MTTPPPVSSSTPSDPAGQYESSRPWREIIDGWVKDPKIRRDTLIAFVLLLAAIAAMVAIALPSGASVLSSALSSSPGKIILGTGVAGVLCTAGVMRHRKRTRSREQPALRQVPQVPPVPGVSGVFGTVPPGGDDPIQPPQQSDAT